VRVVTPVERLEHLTGRGRAHADICEGLAARGHEIVVVARDLDEGAPRWSEFATLIPWPDGAWAKVLRRRPVSTSMGLLRLARVIAAQHADVIYVPQRLLHTVGAVGSMLGRVPAVSHLHDPPRRWDRQDRLAHRRIATMIAVSDAQAEAWRRSGVATTMEVVHNGVRTDEFCPPTAEERAAARASFDLAPNDRVVSFVGRIHRDKGVHVLVEAMAQVIADRPEARLLLAGFVDDPAYLDELLAASVPERTTWAGTVDPVRRAYWASDVTVCPSIYPDPFPLAPLESMACGVPAIVSTSGGLPEGIPPEEPTFVVPAGDTDRLTLVLRGLLDWRSDRPALGDDLRRHIELRFPATNLLDGVERVLRGVARGR
jgi:glycosyltransferase involved in cell wall biosynthesis